MKKTLKILTACLLMFGIVSCADDKKSSNAGTQEFSIPEINIEDNFTAKLGESSTNTITIKNPFDTEATINVNNIVINNSTITSLNNVTMSTTCGTLSANYNLITGGSLQANGSCEITYTYTPSELETKLLSFDYNIIKSTSVLCPTPETVLTYDQMTNSQISYNYKINNYTEDSNGNKSPAIIYVDLGTVDYLSNGISYADITAKPFSINLTQGDTYSISNIPYTIIADNTNCSLEGNTITALKTGECTLNISYTYNEGKLLYLDPSISITPNNSTDNTKPVYVLNLTYNVKYYYDIISPSSTSTAPEFSLSYTKGLSNGNSIDVVKLENGATETFTIGGTHPDKFNVIATPFDGCNISGNSITIPEGKTFCFYTVDFKDKNTDGNFTATLTVNNTTTYDINGTIDDVNILLQTICQQYSTQTSAKFLDKYIK